jgi:hypothetical protein
VAASEWLAPALRPELSCGDIIDGVPFCTPQVPVVHLKKSSAKNLSVIWVPGTPPPSPPVGQTNYALFAYRVGHGIIVSHDCELEKPNRTLRVLLAPVAPIEALDSATAAVVRNQAHLARMLLPSVPGLGDAYVDLRQITPMPLDLITERPRVASLTDAARHRLGLALIAFFVKREFPVP